MDANFKNRSMMKSGATGLAVLLIGLSCYAQPDDTEIWSKAWNCVKNVEDITQTKDIDVIKECMQIMENLSEDQDLLDQKLKERLKKFALYNGCQPMYLVVEELSTDGKEIGISREAVQNALESRLRAAHLYLPGIDSAAFLYVQVSVAGSASRIRLQFRKIFTDELSSVESNAL